MKHEELKELKEFYFDSSKSLDIISKEASKMAEKQLKIAKELKRIDRDIDYVIKFKDYQKRQKM